MIYLPILINGRRWYVAPFVNEIANGGTIPKAEFVVALSEHPVNTKYKAVLFELNKELTQIIRETEENIDLHEVGFEKEAPGSGNKATFEYINNSHIHYFQETKNEDDTFEVSCNFDHPKNISTDYDLKIRIGDDVFVTKLCFHVSKASNMFEVVMDFGSESSQMLIKKNDEQTGKLVDILQDLVSYHANTKGYEEIHADFNNQRVQILQHDKDNNCFYKSNFYIVNERIVGNNRVTNYFKTDNSSNDYTNEPFCKDDEPIKVCFKLDEERKFPTDASFPIPNLKVLEKCPWVYKDKVVKTVTTFRNITAVKHVSFSDENIRNNVMREIVNNFSHVMLKEVIEKIIHDGIDDKVNIQFKFFVPNIYNYEKSLKLMQLINDDLKIIVNNNKVYIQNAQNRFFDYEICRFINKVEVSILSESDASFLGLYKNIEIAQAINKINNRKEKILLIDCGKGTTDISIIEIIDGKPISNYRNGIAGAGNYINYAFIEALFRQTKIDSEDKLIDKLKEFIDYTGNIKQFMDVVEQYKRNYYKSSKVVNLTNVKFDDGITNKKLNSYELFTNGGINLSEFTKFITSYSDSSLSNIEPIINKYVNDLSSEIIKNIEYSGVNLTHIKLVLLTGRGFKFNPLYNEVEQLLREKLTPKSIIPFFDKFKIKDTLELIPDLRSKIDLKNICLYGGLNMNGQHISDNPTFDIKTIAPGNFLGIFKSKKTQQWINQNLESLESNLLTGVTLANTVTGSGALNIGGENYNYDANDVGAAMNLYFVGSINNTKSPYLLKCSDSNKKVDLSTSPANSDGFNDMFVLKTLFPFIDKKEISIQNGFAPVTTLAAGTTKKYTL